MEPSPVEKTKKPANSAFRQQRLTAWQPILTAGTVLPSFFIIGSLFIPIGIVLLMFSDNVKEMSVEYTDCLSVGSARSSDGELEKADIDDYDQSSLDLFRATNGTNSSSTTAPPAPAPNATVRCADQINQQNSLLTCICAPMQFRIRDDYQGQVYIYYALTNFYQNHRRYVTSRDDKQLIGDLGDVGDWEEPSHDCIPFQKIGLQVIYPCGAIANSMFSDQIKLYFQQNSTWVQVPLTNKGVAWESDITHKFKHPKWWAASLSNPAHPARLQFAKPPAWRNSIWNLTDGIRNEDFIVWMRLSAHPDFRKLFRIVVHKQNDLFKDGLPKGTYRLDINYSFPVKSFKGTKSIVLSTTSLMGGKNPFLGIAYIVVGSICLVLGLMFFLIHVSYASKLTPINQQDVNGVGGTVNASESEESLAQVPLEKVQSRSSQVSSRVTITRAAQAQQNNVLAKSSEHIQKDINSHHGRSK